MLTCFVKRFKFPFPPQTSAVWADRTAASTLTPLVAASTTAVQAVSLCHRTVSLAWCSTLSTCPVTSTTMYSATLDRPPVRI